jgi:hypothetical protein
MAHSEESDMTQPTQETLKKAYVKPSLEKHENLVQVTCSPAPLTVGPHTM